MVLEWAWHTCTAWKPAWPKQSLTDCANMLGMTRNLEIWLWAFGKYFMKGLDWLSTKTTDSTWFQWNALLWNLRLFSDGIVVDISKCGRYSKTLKNSVKQCCPNDQCLMLKIMHRKSIHFKYTKIAGYGNTCQQSKHLGSWSRRILNSRTA